MAFPRKPIAVLIGQLAGAQCIWVDDANPQVGASGRGETWVELSLLSDVPKGDGEYRQAQNPANPNALLSTIVLTTLVTISLRAKSFDAKRQAYEMLKDVRAKLRTVTAAAVHADNNIAFVRTQPIAGVRAVPIGNRTRLEATMDVVWSMLDGGDPGDDDGLTLGSASPPLITGR
jgi:hypothetical protein